MIAVIDYGMGNLRSVQKALEKVGAEAVITDDPSVIEKADKIVLPGVGAIKPAVERLQDLGLVETIEESIEEGKPFFGICLGYQMLFESSEEGFNIEGLGILEGSVDLFKPSKGLKVPQMGWNQLKIENKDCKLFDGIKDGTNVYFCHSYFVNPKDKSIVAASTNYGSDFASAICKGNIYGVQFHPEKSQAVGLKILENFNKL